MGYTWCWSIPIALGLEEGFMTPLKGLLQCALNFVVCRPYKIMQPSEVQAERIEKLLKSEL